METRNSQIWVVEVIVGKKEYEKQCGVPAAYNKPRVVLIDVDSTILQEDKLWYYFPRKVSRTPGGAEVKIDETTRQKYRTGQQDHFDIWIYFSNFCWYSNIRYVSTQTSTYIIRTILQNSSSRE